MTPAKQILDLDRIVAMVREFHEVFGHPVSENRGDLTARRAYQRLGYLAEEFLEGYQAAISQNPINVIDAMADAIYFAAGNLVEQGAPANYFEAFAIENEVDDQAYVRKAKGAWHSRADDIYKEFRSIFAMSLSETSAAMSDNRESFDLIEMSQGIVGGFAIILFTAFRIDALDVLTEVHRSNMSKLLSDTLDNKEACRAFMKTHGCHVPIDELEFTRTRDGRWIAMHIGTEKIIKNPLFSEPDLAPIYQAAMNKVT